MTATQTGAVTQEEMVARARALRPLFQEHQAETNRLRHPPEVVHEAIEEAGLYRLLMPRRYGGLECDVTTHVRVWMELARADMSAAWYGCLAANHPLQVASWFGERAQEEIFGAGAFRAPAVIIPLSSPARRIADGWELNGKVSYCSGAPFSTHYLGQAIAEDGTPIVFVAPRSAYTVLDDWGDLIGLKGSGSNSIVFEAARVPAHWVLEGVRMAEIDVSADSPGVRIHGNPMYGGRTAGFFAMAVATTMVGAGLGALDEFARILRTRRTTRPPIRPRMHDPEFQRVFGAATARLRAAEALIIAAAERHMELCRAAVAVGRPYTYGDDQVLAAIVREAGSAAWDAMQNLIYRYAGSSASREGERLEQTFRDMATGWGHYQTANDSFFHAEIAREHFGLRASA
jgi:3-hydroxy-9,10-secoandrosta-1,3,5(10)-triene-9,17-dione monooxygenase